MNPFDFKAALLAPHAQHPAVVHFPVALLLTSTACDWLALWRKNAALAVAARVNLAAAAWTAPLALTTGLAAWQWQFEGARLKGNLRLHLFGALISAALIWLLCWWRARRADRDAALTLAGDRSYLILTICAAVCVALTGHLGSFVSGVSGAPHP